MKSISGLGEDRALIFRNFCNRVPKEDIAEAFFRSVDEVTKDVLFVAKKIREYRHRRCLQPHPEQGMLPYIPCGTEAEILSNKAALLRTLQFIGPETLATEFLVIPTLTAHKMETPEHVREAARAVRARAA
jgi:hypothetical protein